MEHMKVRGSAGLLAIVIGSAAAPVAAQQLPAFRPPPVEAVRSAALTVRVEGLAEGGGFVRLAVFDRADDFPDEPLLAEVVPASAGAVEWNAHLVPGSYAIAAFHDRDGDGVLNRNLLGMPTEAYGFSRGARGRFGPPAFADAVVELRAPGVVVELQIR